MSKKTVELDLKWFEYSQNNSGGSFQHSASLGIGYRVWIQATSAEDADRRAQEIGLYFDGYGDCSCCGDRWTEKSGWDDGQDEEPTNWRSELSWGIPSYAHPYGERFYRVTKVRHPRTFE